MNRIFTPQAIEEAPTAAQPTLELLKRRFGMVPNLFRVMSNSPAALTGFLGLSDALARGQLSMPTRDRIALAVAEINSCEYCLTAHIYLGKEFAKLDDAEIEANRSGFSNDLKANVAVRFAVKLTQQRGQVDEEDFDALRSAGYSDGEIVEIMWHVALNIATNYINVANQTEIDFPSARA
jgi:uncharacterized peroxidase-related enzyme